jgi:dephospho-CoA kinase
MVIGVTGLYAAGKDQVSRILRERGFSEIDVDALGHRVLTDCSDDVVRLFGPVIIGPDSQIDRRALGRIVFAHPGRLRRLEALLHPRMRELVVQAVHSPGGGDYVINAALLFPMGLAELADLVLVVRAPFCTRWRRARTRDGLDWRAFLDRCRSQRKIVPKPDRESVDIHTIWNTRNLMYLTQQMDAIMLRHATDVKKDGNP